MSLHSKSASAWDNGLSPPLQKEVWGEVHKGNPDHTAPECASLQVLNVWTLERAKFHRASAERLVGKILKHLLCKNIFF